jgi:CHRD domain
VKGLAVCTAAATAVLTLALAGSGVARPQASEIRVAAAMNAAQEVPAPNGSVSGGRGAFAATVSRSGSGATMSWELAFGGLTGSANAAHVHIAPRGQAGGVAVPLCGPCQSPASGTATIDANVLQALESGGAYVNVHTPTNAAGEIRGQIAVTAALRTALTARQEVPRPKGRANRASGLFTATVTRSGTSGAIAWRLTFNRLTGRAVAAHIHIGARGRAGGVALPLCGPCRNGARGTGTLSASLLAALEAGRAYVNVHTRQNLAGEIRGQLPQVPLRITP